jgi:serine/threonine-protein kinase RsbW
MSGPAPEPAAPQKVFHMAASDGAVRAALASMRFYLRGSGLDDDACGTAEIVLAEALNNVVEHAYGGGGCGDIRVTLVPRDGALTAEIVDWGAALPGLSPPAGRLPPLGGTIGGMPEGGFGWFLIRTLSDSLCYKRHGRENRLSLCLALPFARPA